MERTGIVKWFNTEKGYGFLAQTNDGDLFFHINNGRNPEMNYYRGEMTIIWNTPKGYSLRNPKVGDEIVYSIGSGSKGPVADRWVFKSSYDFVDKQIKNLPMYRVMRQFDDNPPDELWRGIWLENCSNLYYDPQFDGVPFNHDDFRSEKWWETKTQSATETVWKKCPCPLIRKK